MEWTIEKIDEMLEQKRKEMGDEKFYELVRKAMKIKNEDMTFSYKCHHCGQKISEPSLSMIESGKGSTHACPHCGKSYITSEIENLEEMMDNFVSMVMDGMMEIEKEAKASGMID